MNATKFIHLSAHGITIGYQIDDANQQVNYAFSRTAPNDTFSKARGRQIVTGRLNKGGTMQSGRARSHTIKLATIGSTRYADISKALCESVETAIHDEWTAHIDAIDNH